MKTNFILVSSSSEYRDESPVMNSSNEIDPFLSLSNILTTLLTKGFYESSGILKNSSISKSPLSSSSNYLKAFNIFFISSCVNSLQGFLTPY